MKNYEPNRKRKKFTDWYKSIYDGDQSFSGHEKTMKKTENKIREEFFTFTVHRLPCTVIIVHTLR